jgi:hypothetical protein
MQHMQDMQYSQQAVQSAKAVQAVQANRVLLKGLAKDQPQLPLGCKAGNTVNTCRAGSTDCVNTSQAMQLLHHTHM